MAPSPPPAAAIREGHHHHHHHHHNGCRWPSLPLGASASDNGRPRRRRLLILPPSEPSSPCCSSARESRFRGDLRLNDIVRNGVSGVLNKWVNYGRGWRLRWFVLQDGVLSYYKIHGPDRIELAPDDDLSSKVIGEESFRRISRRKKGHPHLPRRPVSSIRESRSDERRFSIFSGTKRLHLRADTRENRLAWMEALLAVKDMFPRISNSELMAPVDNVIVSTEKLRQRLLEEGMSEGAIQDTEQIMRSEFASLQDQVVLLKQKQILLLDTLRQLETEKVDLENTLIDENHQRSRDCEPTSVPENGKFSGMVVTTSIYNLILGKLYCDHYGTMRIQGNGEYSCKLKFKEQSIIDRNPHQVICSFAFYLNFL
ncbi:hypothetical protein BHE74_00043519 [Ensete ventricosum]|nr:hypothetical protein GW17_00015682 [Ensete ventricosum]RWW50235.1 hypothetical protein BHE74_00043519 [Ensete ventricosum]